MHDQGFPQMGVIERPCARSLIEVLSRHAGFLRMFGKYPIHTFDARGPGQGAVLVNLIF